MIRFVYPYNNVSQLSFDGNQRIIKQIVGLGHILRVFGDHETILCRKTQEKIEEDHDGLVKRDNRIMGIPICEKCQDVWKNEPGSPWKKWQGEKDE